MLVLDDVSIRIAGRLLLDGASARIPDAARVGLVGRNGIGKTTLFRAIAGEIGVEHGAIGMPLRARIGRLAQEAPSGRESLLEAKKIAGMAETVRLNVAVTAVTPSPVARAVRVYVPGVTDAPTVMVTVAVTVLPLAVMLEAAPVTPAGAPSTVTDVHRPSEAGGQCTMVVPVMQRVRTSCRC